MNTIIVGIDFKDNTLKICKEAVHYARKLKSSITLVHAVEYIPYYPYFPYDQDKIDSFHDSHINWQVGQLESFIKMYKVKLEPSIIRQGNTYEVLCEAADEVNANAIIVGVGEHFLFDQLIGSTTEKVSRMAKQKVIILNHRKELKLKKVMTAYDFSANSITALESAIRFALYFKSKLYVTHVCHSEFEEDLVSRQIDLKVQEIIANQKAITGFNSTVDYEIKVLHGSTVPVIMNLIDELDIDLLSIGSSGHNSFTHLFIGSTVSKIIRKSPCTIVVSPKKAAVNTKAQVTSA